MSTAPTASFEASRAAHAAGFDAKTALVWMPDDRGDYSRVPRAAGQVNAVPAPTTDDLFDAIDGRVSLNDNQNAEEYRFHAFANGGPSFGVGGHGPTAPDALASLYAALS